jgi:fumarate reductase subunit C
VTGTTVKTKEYVRTMHWTWWLHNRQLTLFMIRELSSVFVGAYAIYLLAMLYSFGQGRQAAHAFFQALRSPASIALQLLALLFVAYHSITSFNAAPVLMVVWRGDEKVNPNLIIGANYLLWLVLSVLVFVAAFWAVS